MTIIKAENITEKGAGFSLIDDGIRTWRYKMPYLFFLLYQRQYEGTVQAKDRVHARAEVKKLFVNHRYPLKRFPVNGILEQENINE